MTRKGNKSIPLRKPSAVAAKRRAPKVTNAKSSWIMEFLGVMPDLGDPVTIQRELRRERK